MTETAESRFISKVFAWADHKRWLTPLWASIKSLFVIPLLPIAGPLFAKRAADNHRRASETAHRLRSGIQRIAESSQSTESLDLGHVADVDSEIKMVVVSDLHRCTAGPSDWPKRQGTDLIYQAMLRHYGNSQWHLCENGDVDDFWMCGGTPKGSAYDVLRVLGGVCSEIGRPKLIIETYRRQLREIVANNETTYGLLAENFARHGRYLRTVGNHDDPMRLPEVQEELSDILPGAKVSDAIALRDKSQHLVALLCHGHLTDGWNAPGRDMLGKISSWVSSSLTDVPFIPAPSGLPSMKGTNALLAGKAPNKLVAVHPVFGATGDYDSLDEQVLFDALEPDDDDPWLFMGHTHYPIFAPLAKQGTRWQRYVNSGSGILPNVVTAIEWDGTSDATIATLVCWTWSDLAPLGAEVVSSHEGRDLVRFELVPSEDGTRIVPKAMASNDRYDRSLQPHAQTR